MIFLYILYIIFLRKSSSPNLEKKSISVYHIHNSIGLEIYYEKEYLFMIHIYYGDGKGKTTAATGLAVRAAGRDLKVLFVQFLKTMSTGERTSLKQLSNITLAPCPVELKFTFTMSEEEKENCARLMGEIFRVSAEKSIVGKFDMIILDELLTAVSLNMVSHAEVYEFLSNAPQTLEIVLTGHEVPEKFSVLADYITHFVNEKHPYQRGIPAREGIEF